MDTIRTSGFEKAGAMSAGRARAVVTGGFTWRPPAYESGVSFVVDRQAEAPDAVGSGTLLLGVTFWLAVAAMTLVSFDAPQAKHARPNQALAASRPVFVAQPAIAPPVTGAPVVSVVGEAMTASDAGTRTVAVTERARTRQRAIAAVPAAPPGQSAAVDGESALAVDALTRSRGETTF